MNGAVGSGMGWLSSVGVLPEIVLIGTALFVMSTEMLLGRRQASRLPMLGALGAILALLAAGHTYRAGPYSVFLGAIAVDGWTAVMRGIVIGAGVLALISGHHSHPLAAWASRATKGEEEKECEPERDGGSGREEESFLPPEGTAPGEFTGLILLSLAGLTFLAASRDLLITVIALELASLPLYPLVVRARTRAGVEAGVKYFLMGATASAVMLFGLSLIVGVSGTTRYAAVRFSNTDELLGILLFLSGLFFKIAAVPFHAWMPDAYEAAPAPVGAFMAAAVKAGAFGALGRIVISGGAAPQVLTLAVIGLAAPTLFLGNGAALFQQRLGRLWGYSSISHTGFLLMGIAASLQLSATGGLVATAVYLAAYVPAVIGGFCILGIIENSSPEDPLAAGKRSVDRLKGFFTRSPFLAVAFTITLASMAGLPPTAGFWAKLSVFKAAYEAGHIGLLLVALFNSLMAAYYYVRMIRMTFSDPETAGGEEKEAGWRKPPMLYGIVAGFSAIVLLALGIFPAALFDPIVTAMKRIVL
ncbi:MAG: NADH-quinone oxidoreductase subunit N [Candidatus Hydrogenedentota bacterium]|nr:MAG: NADH-quinone oxidoreductase subunit N [Candidatus Hydrogenedentota bacterium]